MRGSKPDGKLPPVSELGHHLDSYERKDGTVQIVFRVRRNRPSGWFPKIDVFDGYRSPEADIKIRRRAAELLEALQIKREAQSIETNRRDFRAGLWLWQSCDPWDYLAPNTVENYKSKANIVLDWSRAAGHPPMNTLTRAAARHFIDQYRDRPEQARALKQFISRIYKYAIAEGWCENDPFDNISIRSKTAKVTLWEQSDIDAYVAAADELGIEGIKTFILIGWTLGQRLEDIANFQHRKHYDDGVFRFHQQKTGEYLQIEAPQILRDVLDKSHDSLYLVQRDETGRPYQDRDAWGVDFDKVRALAHESGAQWLLLRHLRHSVVVQLSRAGCTIPEIASITGHTIKNVHSILQKYLPRDTKLAQKAMNRRFQ